MKTDKNTLFRAIGEIDEKYVSEILEEDASAASVIKSFDAARAATSAKKKASGTKKFLMYYLPAVAGFLLCAIIVKSFMTSNVSESASAGNSAATADCAAPEPASVPNSVYDSTETNGSESMDAASIVPYDEDEKEPVHSELSAEYAAGDGDIMIDGMPNPFVDCDSLEEACEIAGIDLEIPDDFGFEFERIYRAMDGRMIEVIFMDGSEEVYRIRKGLVSEFGEDISGDYNEYSVSTNVDSATYAATLNGNGEDEVSNAVWNDGTYAYSITFEDPVSVRFATDIIEMIMAK